MPQLELAHPQIEPRWNLAEFARYLNVTTGYAATLLTDPESTWHGCGMRLDPRNIKSSWRINPDKVRAVEEDAIRLTSETIEGHIK